MFPFYLITLVTVFHFLVSPQVVLLILGCFTVCWMPYLVVVSIHVFKFMETGSARFYKAAFCLAMANSGINPLIYAWKNAAFRKAFGKLLRCQRPDLAIQEPVESVRSTQHRRSSQGIHRQETINSLRTDFGTPPSSARTRANSSDLETGIDAPPIDGGGPRGSITDSGVVVIMKHKRLSSISSEHRNSATTISEETCSNHTTVVMFSTSQDNESDYMETPKKTLESNRSAKLIRNKCAILESFDSISDESSVGEPRSPGPGSVGRGYQKTCASPPPSPLVKQFGLNKVTTVLDSHQINGRSGGGDNGVGYPENNNNNSSSKQSNGKKSHNKFIFNFKKSLRAKVKQQPTLSPPSKTMITTTVVDNTETGSVTASSTTCVASAPVTTALTTTAVMNNNKNQSGATIVVAERYKVNENVDSIVVGKL